MGYNAPSTKAYGDLVDSGDWNELVNNQLHFAATTLAEKVHIPASVVSITSTSFVDADATNLTLSITTERGNRVYAMAAFACGPASAANAFYDLALDGVRAGDATNGLALVDANHRGYLTIFGEWSSIAAGAHTMRIQVKTSSGAVAAEIQQYAPVKMAVWE